METRWIVFVSGHMRPASAEREQPVRDGTTITTLGASLTSFCDSLPSNNDAGTRRVMTSPAQKGSLKQCWISPIRSSLATSAAGLTFLSSRLPSRQTFDLPHGTRLSMGLDMTSISERSHVG